MAAAIVDWKKPVLPCDFFRKGFIKYESLSAQTLFQVLAALSADNLCKQFRQCRTQSSLDVCGILNEPPHGKTNNLCIGENKGADQLRSNCEADQRLCFRYSEISSF